MSYTLSQLADEINNDPKSLGYSTLVASGDDSSIAGLLNSTYAGVGTVYRPNVGAGEVMGSLVWSEVSGLTTNNWLALHSMLLPASIDATKSTVRNFFNGLFPTGSFATTNANLLTVAKKASPSRAEELWGAGTVVPFLDVSRAIRG
jgi:hypothetical protein